jgi:hypothetical protein
MQDDKLDIQKILRNDPEEATDLDEDVEEVVDESQDVAEPVNTDQDVEEVVDESQDVAEPVNTDQDADDSDVVKPVIQVEDVMAGNSQDVEEPVNTDQDADDSEEVESAEDTKEVEDVMADESQDVVEPVDTDQDADDSDEVESAEETKEVEDVMVDRSPKVVAPEVLDKAVNKQPQPEQKAPKEPLTAEEKKDRIMKVLVPMLLVAFVFIGKKSFFPAPKDSMAQKVQPVEVQTNMPSQWQLPDEYPSSLRDPMKFGSVSSQQQDVASGSLVLKGIVFSSTPAAMVSGRIVKEGDEVMGATVVEIKRESVVFRSGDQQWEQKIKR